MKFVAELVPETQQVTCESRERCRPRTLGGVYPQEGSEINRREMEFKGNPLFDRRAMKPIDEPSENSSGVIGGKVQETSTPHRFWPGYCGCIDAWTDRSPDKYAKRPT